MDQQGRTRASDPPVPPNGKPTCARFLAISVDFLTVHPSTNNSPQSTPRPRSLQDPRMFSLTASSSFSERSSDSPIRTSCPFRPLAVSAHDRHRSTSGTRNMAISRVFNPRGRPFQVGFLLLVQTFLCLLMRNVERSTIAMPWNGGGVLPIQRGHSPSSFLSFGALFF